MGLDMELDMELDMDSTTHRLLNSLHRVLQIPAPSSKFYRSTDFSHFSQPPKNLKSVRPRNTPNLYIFRVYGI